MFTVQVFLADHMGAPFTTFKQAADFNIDRFDTSTLQALDIAFAVCNSYPDELHCEQQYEPIVRMYRANHNRSLSVGDFVLITANGEHDLVLGYRCEMVGWHLIPAENWPQDATDYIIERKRLQQIFGR